MRRSGYLQEVTATRLRDYERDESRAHQLDRNWSELVQELRVMGTGVQILFAFELSIAFQARFARTSPFQRDVYLATLMLTGLGSVLLIAPVAVHRFLFRFGAKDEIVDVSNAIVLAGIAVLSLGMIGAILLVSDWVAGPAVAAVCTTLTGIFFAVGWLLVPLWLRRRAQSGAEPAARGPA